MILPETWQMRISLFHGNTAFIESGSITLTKSKQWTRADRLSLLKTTWMTRKSWRKYSGSSIIPTSLFFFGDSVQALEYLTNTDIEPFLVLSDINMPKLNGMELREKIHNNEDLRLKSIPYLFFSTSAEQRHVIDAYSRSIQGFFVKPRTHDKLKKIIVKIVEYWQECESPNYIKNAQQ